MKLETRHFRAAACLAAGQPKADAARNSGVSEAAVRKWERDPDFMAMLEAITLPRPDTTEATAPENWRELLEAHQATGATDAIAYLRRGVAPDAPVNASGVKAATTLIDLAGVTPLRAAEQSEHMSEPEVVVECWHVNRRTLIAALALKDANPFVVPTLEQAAEALAS